MNPDKNIFRLEHVVESIEKIEFIIKDLSYAQYLEDWIKQDAIVRNIEIIGEAIRNVEEKIIAMYPNVPWKEARGMRNILVHEYFRIEHEEVWRTLNEDLPKLKSQIISIINDIK
ncbi:HepT-like ribonuclease domain-containing protein [Flavobacterium aestuarii]|uniref:HepT-like ribonuclease domain-containing protein n=1 Tax=Flavobacterium aestuarii TaxID=3149227 RepID=UPI0032B323CC